VGEAMKKFNLFLIIAMIHLVFGIETFSPLSAYPQEVSPKADSMEVVNHEERWKAEFFVTLEKADTISYLKEEVLKKYIAASRVEKSAVEFVKKLESMEVNKEKLDYMRWDQVRQANLKLHYLKFQHGTFSKQNLIRQYKFLLRKEQLNQAYQNHDLSEPEYFEKTRDIDQAIAKLEQLATLQDIGYGIMDVQLTSLKEELAFDLLKNRR
jgi:hypothetical protein